MGEREDTPETPLLGEEERIQDDDGAVSDLSLGSDGSAFPRNEFRKRIKRTFTRMDSLDVEAMQIPGLHHMSPKDHTLAITLQLAFQTIGVVYGDMGTSPLYVFSSAFESFGIDGTEDILGALSIIIYTLTLIPLVKYVFVVLRANNNGEGGTFSLYSLICRYAKVNLLPNRQPEDERLSNFKINLPTKRLERALKIKDKLEKRNLWKNVLLIVALLGASLVMGDGILTPCISVMSAVSGLKVALPSLSQDVLVVISLMILIFLFSIQRFGTGKVGFLFAPILCIWFAAIGIIGLYNIFRHNTIVFRAFNPAYIFLYFMRNKFNAWSSLGGLVLCITGGEAMFADLGHFSVRSIQIAFSCVVYPCLLSAYMGQAAYLVQNPSDVSNAFYKSIPAPVYWPMFGIATLAAMIASQAMISATFSVIKMALAMNCFPRVKVIHTSKRFMGQIYIPVINWFLMFMCLVITVTFKTTEKIGNAYGLAVVGDMLVTTSLVTLIMVMIWQTSLYLALSFILVIGSVELLYMSAVLLKVKEGGWVPLTLASVVLLVMYAWHYGSRMKYKSEVDRKISLEYMLELGPDLKTDRVPGVALLYSELVRGVPVIFGYFIKSLPAIHSVVVFVCIKYVPVPVVPQSERFLFRRICPRGYHMFRCVARYGYKDIRKEDHFVFEQLLLQSLEIFVRKEDSNRALEIGSDLPMESNESGGDDSVPLLGEDLNVTLTPEISEIVDPSIEEPSSSYHYPAIKDSAIAMELSHLHEAKVSGVVYLLGDSDVRAKKDSWFLKKLVINYFYGFLSRNCRATSEALSVPHTNLLEVGMTYMV